MTTSTGKGRGFKSLDVEERKRIASIGGKEAHRRGTAHKWSKAEAIEAGRKGGSISKRRPSERRISHEKVVQ